MTKLSDELRKLIELQKIDIEIDLIQERISEVPVSIKNVENTLQENKSFIEQYKNNLQKLQVEQNEKNIDLEAIEQIIKKHTTELNIVKSNQAYRALLDEIEESKKQKSAAEDGILKIYEEIDNLTKIINKKKSEMATQEIKAQQDIQKLQESGKELEQCQSDKKSLRAVHTSEMSKKILDMYEYLRSKKNKLVVVPVEGQGCGGCHMKLRVDNINQLYRLYSAESDSSEMVQCDNCSRILFLSDGLPTS